MMKRLFVGSVLSLLTALGATAQQKVVPVPLATPANVAEVPFGIGEKVVYGVSWGIFGRRGTATSEVVAVEPVRGHASYHLNFRLQGRVLAFGINDLQESWLDVDDLYSHRFKQNLNQTSYKRLRTLDFFPSEGMWRQLENADSGALASDEPLDDVSFLYWVRTLDLQVGKRYTFDRYFKESGNPVIVEVLRKEKIKVPAGEFDTIVVRPLIKTSGLFSEGGQAEIYFSDDDDRIVVMLKTKLSVGTATLRLEQYTAGRQLPGNPLRP